MRRVMSLLESVPSSSPVWLLALVARVVVAEDLSTIPVSTGSRTDSDRAFLGHPRPLRTLMASPARVANALWQHRLVRYIVAGSVNTGTANAT